MYRRIKHLTQLVTAAGVSALVALTMVPQAHAKRVYAKVVNVQATQGGSKVIINRGAKHGLAVGQWVWFLTKSGKPLRRGGTKIKFKCARVTDRECTGRVRLTLDDVRANPRVLYWAAKRSGHATGKQRHNARVVGMRLSKGATELTINRGYNGGVTRSTRVRLLTASGTTARTSTGQKSFRCARITAYTCVVRVKMGLDWAKSQARYAKLSGLRRVRRPGNAARKQGRVVGLVKTSDGMIKVTINRGSTAGLEVGAKLWFLAGKSGRLLKRGGGPVGFTCTKVTKRECVGTVRLSYDDVRANPHVQYRGRR